MNDITNLLMGQAWERAKGELKSLEYTSMPHGFDKDSREYYEAKCERRSKLVEDFIEQIEAEELHQV